ncbi:MULTISPECIES: DUF3159 domain-containing protein [Gordonia]|uniref:DUF3159 domain-containing protein n=1 Tax=unclassified Gordonia (in: high G+C Gram-positive bacteria) TaxID=2657482 RepID=UPI0007EA2CB4|nr:MULTISPECIES: DUF3159 domain-containing protein [unclassified Gordonia (in: high G+C Gram-positive bacteria)]OBC03719.1 hypothetical protein A5786_14630 [Gordonia sp. 852002-50816_SCH5313054-a]OBC18938.1 hypothetical protein A5788_02015 [Gordonia sp. 852002-50816_SCH5313054-c]
MATEKTDSPDAASEVDAAERSTATVLGQLGGVSGLISSMIPVIVFVVVNAAFGVTAAIVAALCTAALVAVVRLLRRDGLAPAVSGFLGVAICAFIAHRVGDAKGYFLLGIWTSLVYAGVLLASILVRWPLIGVAWNYVNGAGTQWRSNRRTLIAYDIATAFWALVFAGRYLAQSSLYDSGDTGWLAVARIGMGWPLTALAVVVTVLLVRRASRASLTSADRNQPTQIS